MNWTLWTFSLYEKQNYREDEKTNYREEENICKLYIKTQFRKLLKFSGENANTAWGKHSWIKGCTCGKLSHEKIYIVTQKQIHI